MKQCTKIFASTLMLTFGLYTHSFGQSLVAGNAKKASGIMAVVTQEMDIATGIDAINPAAVSSFSALFPNATEQKWGEKDSYYLVYFLNNGQKAAACFSENGKMSYAITECPAERLPKAFNKKIKKDYAAYRLLKGTEIQAYGQTVYQAIIENASEFITLRYNLDGVEEMQIVKK